jgi:hypothetical protein
MHAFLVARAIFPPYTPVDGMSDVLCLSALPVLSTQVLTAGTNEHKAHFEAGFRTARLLRALLPPRLGVCCN